MPPSPSPAPRPAPRPTPQASPDEQPVRLAKSLLTGRVYAARYAEQHDDHPRVIERYDVTEDFRALADSEHAARQLLEDPLAQSYGVGDLLDDEAEARLRDVIRQASNRGVHSDTVDADTAHDTPPVEPNSESGAG